MKKTHSILALAVIAVLFAAVPMPAATTAHFLKLAADARTASLGQAVTALPGSAGTLFWNPAGLTEAGKFSGQAGFSMLYQGMFGIHAAFASEQKFGSLAAGFLLVSSGSIPVTELEGGEVVETGDKFAGSDMTGVLGYGRRFGKLFSAGAAVKFVRSAIEKESLMGLAFDAGLLSRRFLKDSLAVGLAARNIGTMLGSGAGALPFSVTVGAVFRKDFGEHGACASFDSGYVQENGFVAAVGVEYSFRKLVFIRLGVRPLDDTGIFSAGAGLSLKKIALDYGIGVSPELGLTHRIGVGYGL